MQIGILSDSHNNTKNLRAALQLFETAGIRTLIHCGDITTAETAREMAGFHVIHVFGNGDLVDGEIRETLRALNPENFSGSSFSGEIDGVRIAAAHGHDLSMLYSLIESGRYQYVFRGHSHRREDTCHGSTRVINPGALGGRNIEERTVYILDLQTGDGHFEKINTI
jgi:putative phosphoesterase